MTKVNPSAVSQQIQQKLPTAEKIKSVIVTVAITAITAAGAYFAAAAFGATLPVTLVVTVLGGGVGAFIWIAHKRSKEEEIPADSTQAQARQEKVSTTLGNQAPQSETIPHLPGNTEQVREEITRTEEQATHFEQQYAEKISNFGPQCPEEKTKFEQAKKQFKHETTNLSLPIKKSLLDAIDNYSTAISNYQAALNEKDSDHYQHQNKIKELIEGIKKISEKETHFEQDYSEKATKFGSKYPEKKARYEQEKINYINAKNNFTNRIVEPLVANTPFPSDEALYKALENALVDYERAISDYETALWSAALIESKN